MTTATRIECHLEGITGVGPLDADVMFVGIAPGRDEAQNTGIAFTGQSGKLLNAIMSAMGLERADAYLTNLICWWKNEPDVDDIARCAPRLDREIKTIKPKVIVALGALASARFTGHPKFGDTRGSCSWSDEYDCWIVSSWHPAAVLRAPALVADLVRDFWKIEYIQDKPKDFNRVEYEVVDHIPHAQGILDSPWSQNTKFLANDIETKWDPETKKYLDDIRCLGISDGDLTYVFPEPIGNQLTWPTDRRWTFHNGQFDTRVLMTDFGVELPIVEDTMLMSYSLDERGGSSDESPVDLAVGIHGLKKLAREYCAAGFYDINTKTAGDEELWEYNAKDAAYTARLAQLFYARQMVDGRTREVYEGMTLPQMRLSRDEFMYGVYVHQDVLRSVGVSWLEEWLETEEQLVQEANDYGWPQDAPRFNFNSHVQLKRFLNNYLNFNVPNTQAPTLESVDHPWVNKYRRIKRIDKQMSTYVMGTQKVLFPDGRVRPDASIHGTQTGRLTYHRPPIGTVPSGAQYVDPDEEPDEETLEMIKEFSQVRGLFGAPPGKVFVEADYATAELWVAAYYSDDDTMLADLLSGDFHSNAAESMFQVDRNDYTKEHWSQMRRESKFVTFGTLFNRGAKSLYKPAPGQGGNLGKKYTLKEIQVMVRQWHARYYKHAQWAAEEVRKATETGEQENIAGRRRRYHAPALYGAHFANMVVNFPIQSTSHDHLIVSRIELDALYRMGEFPGRTLWDGHDAIYFEIDEADLKESCVIIKEVMEKPRWFERGIPVDIKVGSSWADGKEVDVATL